MDINEDQIKKINKRLFIFGITQFIVLGLIILTFITVGAGIFLFLKTSGQDVGSFSNTAYNSDCNTQVIKVSGILVTSNDFTPEFEGEVLTDSTEVIIKIYDANQNSQIRAIILDIDSPGGLPVAGWDILNASKQSNVPVIAWIRNTAASSAYLAALGSEKIFADANSSVGSIGASASFLDQSIKNKNEGFTYNQISSGEYKDLGSPDKPLTTDEKNLLMNDVLKIKNNFVASVAESRNLSIDTVNSLADGNTFLGKDALANGLIDELGDLSTITAYIGSKIGDSVSICWQ